MTLRQLAYLEALAREGHFTRAAERVGVTQPALSMQLRRMEKSLGVTLVERTPTGPVLTAAGKEVVERGRRILAEVRDLEAAARTRGTKLAGPLRLGVIPTIAPYLLPRVLPELRRRFPAVRLAVQEAHTATLLDELGRGALDLLLLSLPLQEDGLRTLPLFRDGFILAVERGSGLDGESAIPAERLADLPLLLLSDGHCLRDQALSACGMVGRETLDRLGATSLATLTQMVANGMGVTLLPEMAVEAEGRDERIALVPFTAPAPSREIGLAWRATSPHGEGYRRVGEVIREVVVPALTVNEPYRI